MKVVELRLDGTPPLTATLHSCITVLHGMDAGDRQRLIAGFEALAEGRVAGVGGILDAQGVLFAWAPESLRLVGLPPEDDQVTGPIDVVIRPEDLPGHHAADHEAERRMEAALAARDVKRATLDERRATAEELDRERGQLVAAYDERRRRATSDADALLAGATAMARARQEQHRARAERDRLQAVLESHRRRHQALLATQSDAMAAIDAARSRREAAVQARAEAAAALDAARQGTDGIAEVDVEARRRDVAHAEARSAEASARAQEAERARFEAEDGRAGLQGQARAEVDVQYDDSDQVALATEIEGLERRRTELDHQLVAVTPPDPGPVQAALAQVRTNGALEERQRPPEALVFAWRALDDEARELERATAKAETNAERIRAEQAAVAPEPSPGPPPPDPVAAARSRLASARLNYDEASSSVSSAEIDETDIAELEAAHTAVLDAQERTEGRFRGSKATRRLDAARAEERSVLDRLGFSTYADYMMSASNRFGAPGDRAVLEAAQRALATAESEFAEVWQAANPEEPVPDPFVESSPKEILARSVWDDAPASTEVEPAPAPVPLVDSPELIAADAVVADLVERRHTLDGRRKLVRQEAAEVLGREPGDDLIGELTAHRATVPDELFELSRALTGVGVAVNGEALDRSTLIEFADAWLDEHEASAHRRAQLEAELARLGDDLAGLRDRQEQQREQQAPTVDGDSEDVDRLAEECRVRADEAARAEEELEAARRALTTAGEQASRSRLARMLVSERQADLDARTQEVEAATDALAQAEEAVSAAEREELEAITADVSDAEAALETAADAEQAAAQRVDQLTQEQSGPDLTSELAEIQRRTDEVEDRRRSVLAEVDRAAAELDLAQLTVDAEQERAQLRTQTPASDTDSKARLDDIEWYLLSRLAAQRSVSVAGSLPLVLDDTFRDLEPRETSWLLARLERMAATVQVVYVTEAADVAAWATAAGPERAGVARLEAVPAATAG